MEEYVTEFEKLYMKAKTFKLDLPEPVFLLSYQTVQVQVTKIAS